MGQLFWTETRADYFGLYFGNNYFIRSFLVYSRFKKELKIESNHGKAIRFAHSRAKAPPHFVPTANLFDFLDFVVISSSVSFRARLRGKFSPPLPCPGSRIKAAAA
jgi:hypothetical protein